MKSLTDPFDWMFVARKTTPYRTHLLIGDYNVVQFTGENPYLFLENKFSIQQSVRPELKIIRYPFELISINSFKLTSIKSIVYRISETVHYAVKRSVYGGGLFNYVLLIIANENPVILKMLYIKDIDAHYFDKIKNKYWDGDYELKIREMSKQLHSADITIEEEDNDGEEEE